MATVNMASLKVKLAQDQRGRLKGIATERATQIFQDEVVQMQEGFEELSVTQELALGIDAPNLSETLRGGGEPESLYSFIGFPIGTDPLQPIRERLSPDHPDGPKLEYLGKNQTSPTFRFRVRAPLLDKIYRATPMPWAKGMSWAQKIETTIPGFARFLGKFMPNATDQVSRSKGGTQLKHDIRSGSYTPPKDGFLKRLFSDFLASIRSSSSTGRRRGPGGRFLPFD